MLVTIHESSMCTAPFFIFVLVSGPLGSSPQMLAQLCADVQQHAEECRAVVRHTADFEDRSSVETPVFGKAARPMALIKAEKGARAR
jgi:hypothetical protein